MSLRAGPYVFSHVTYDPPSDVLYACGAPGMVESIKAIAGRFGVVCHADPFLLSSGAKESVLTRAMGWLAPPTGRQTARKREQSMEAYRMAEG